MALATPERRFQSEWGTKPSSLVEIISGLLASDLRVGEYKAKVKRRVTRDSFRTLRVYSITCGVRPENRTHAPKMSLMS